MPTATPPTVASAPPWAGTGRRTRPRPVAYGFGLAIAVVLVIALLAAAALVVVERRGRPAMPHLPVVGVAQGVVAGDLGDPFVLPVPATTASPGGYWVFGTNDAPAHVPTAFSPDL